MNDVLPESTLSAVAGGWGTGREPHSKTGPMLFSDGELGEAS
jgi:hypothetical protein